MKLPEFFGIDIGSFAIRVARVEYSLNAPIIKSMAQLTYNEPINNIRDEQSQEFIARRIIEVKEAAGINSNKAVVALPDSMVFSKTTIVPNLPEEQLDQMLYYELQNHIPVGPTEVQKDYIPLGIDPTNPKMMKILLIAAPKSLVELYVGIMHKANIEVLALETETVALARIISSLYSYPNSVLIADFGHKSVDMCVVNNKKIIFSQTIGTASEALSRALAADYGISMQEADRYKYKVGLLEDQADGKILRSFTPIMHVISNEIKKLINYFTINFKDSVPQKILLVGEGSKLPGLSEYLTNSIGIECQKIDPLDKMNISSKLRIEFPINSTTGFTLVTGLAMKTE